MGRLTDADRALLIEWSRRCVEQLQTLPPSRGRDNALRVFQHNVVRYTREATVVPFRRQL